MAQFVHPAVEDVRDDPTPGESVAVVLVVEDGAVDDIEAHVARLDGAVERELPAGTLVVSVPETELEHLCEPSAIESVSLDEGMEVLD